MLYNYLKIAFRNLKRNSLFSLINIAGLSLGMTCFLLILLYTFSQQRYDKHHEAAANLYRVETTLNSNEEPWISATVSPPIVPVMANDFPEVVNATRVVDPPETSHHILKWKNNSFYETKGYYVDSTFFRMFDYDWVEGQANQALQEPYTVVLTKEVKDKLFGRQPALGETIIINNRFGNNDFKISGVVDPSTHKSHIRPHFYMAMNSGGIGGYVRNNDQWAGGNFIFGYIELHPAADPKELENKLPAFLDKYGGNQLRELSMNKELSLQAVKDIHLYSDRNNQMERAGNIGLINILLLIGGFILVIACVNFMNLATAKSMKRALEVGVRKTIGADRSSIARQFFIESLFISGISFLIALLATRILLPQVSNFVQDEIPFHLLFNPIIIGSFLGIYLITAILSGSYPAIYLSSFKPLAVIKGQSFKGGKDAVRKGLVVLQFAISISMIIGSIIILNQLNFIQNSDLGFDQEEKIIIPARTTNARQNLDALKSEALLISGVQNAAGARIYPGEFMAQDFNLFKEGSNAENALNVNLIQGDEDYLTTLGITLLDGRSFNPADTSLQILINQTGLNNFNIPEKEALGKKLISEYNGQRFERVIIGVVKDYHQASLKDPIRPMIFQYTPTDRSLALVLNAQISNNQQLISSIESTWNTLNPDTPFEYQFLDDKLQSQYIQEQRLAKSINLFTLIAIFISCLGLFGLSVFTAEQRMKEIGIRKILGASTLGILSLLSKDFIKLICLALIIASPIAWYFMHGWLEGYAYRVNIQWWMFIAAGIGAIGIAFLTISFQSFRAALANPVDSLKNE